MEDKLKQYANVKNRIKLLELEADALKAEIEPNIPEDGIVTEFGKFYFTKRKSWKYTEAVDKLKETLDAQLKAKQDEEVEDGLAKYTETKILTFKS